MTEGDPRFSRFHLRLSDFMNYFLNVNNIPLPRGQLIKLFPDDQVMSTL